MPEKNENDIDISQVSLKKLFWVSDLDPALVVEWSFVQDVEH